MPTDASTSTTPASVHDRRLVERLSGWRLWAFLASAAVNLGGIAFLILVPFVLEGRAADMLVAILVASHVIVAICLAGFRLPISMKLTLGATHAMFCLWAIRSVVSVSGNFELERVGFWAIPLATVMVSVGGIIDSNRRGYHQTQRFGVSDILILLSGFAILFPLWLKVWPPELMSFSSASVSSNDLSQAALLVALIGGWGWLVVQLYLSIGQAEAPKSGASIGASIRRGVGRSEFGRSDLDRNGLEPSESGRGEQGSNAIQAGEAKPRETKNAIELSATERRKSASENEASPAEQRITAVGAKEVGETESGVSASEIEPPNTIVASEIELNTSAAGNARETSRVRNVEQVGTEASEIAAMAVEASGIPSAENGVEGNATTPVGGSGSDPNSAEQEDFSQSRFTGPWQRFIISGIGLFLLSSMLSWHLCQLSLVSAIWIAASAVPIYGNKT